MHHSRNISEDGVIEAVFAHRFVLRRHDGTRVLADLGPRATAVFTLVAGADVMIEGEAKPCEVKVTRITPRGGSAMEIRHAEHDRHGTVDAVTAVRLAGLDPIGEPRRKPKHFEVLARRGGDLVEVHVEADGRIREEKAADAGKWADAIAAVA